MKEDVAAPSQADVMAAEAVLRSGAQEEPEAGPAPSLLITHLAGIVEAVSVEEAFAAVGRMIRPLGFDRLFYGLSRARADIRQHEFDDVLFLSSFPDAVTAAFFRDGHLGNSPLRRWLMSNTGACSWRWVESERAAGRLSAAEVRSVEFCLAHGVVAGYTLSLADRTPRDGAAISLCARSGLTQADADAIWRRNGAEIGLIARIFHLRAATLPFAPFGRELTARQRETLQWAGDGKSVQDIAVIMGLTPATVEKHLRLARHTLGATTTAHAVRKALSFNQLYPNRR